MLVCFQFDYFSIIVFLSLFPVLSVNSHVCCVVVSGVSCFIVKVHVPSCIPVCLTSLCFPSFRIAFPILMRLNCALFSTCIQVLVRVAVFHCVFTLSCLLCTCVPLCVLALQFLLGPPEFGFVRSFCSLSLYFSSFIVSSVYCMPFLSLH